MQKTAPPPQVEDRRQAGMERRGIFALLHDLTVATADLVHNTARLAACEARIILRLVAVRMGLLLAGLVVAASGLFLVLAGTALVLERFAGVPLWLGCMLVGAATIGAGVAGAMRMYRRLGDPDLGFPRTLGAFGSDIEALRGTGDEPR